MPGLSDEDVGLAPPPQEGRVLSDADVGLAEPTGTAADVEGQSREIPSAFRDRVIKGEIIKRVIDKAMAGAKEGFGQGTPTGLEDSTLSGLIDQGVFHDPARGRPSPVQFMNEAWMLPLAKGWDALTRGINAGVHATGGIVGQIAEELGADQGMAERARRETINMANWAMIEGGMGTFSRPKIGPGGPQDQVIGTLPRDADFRTGAQVLGGEARAVPPPAEGFTRFYHGGAEYEGGPRWLTPDPAYAKGYAGENGKVHYVDIPNDSPHLVKSFDDTGTGQVAPYVSFEAPEEIAKGLKVLNVEGVIEANLRRAWQEDGIHPAEAVHDAQTDAFSRHDITTEPKEFKLDPADEEVLTATGGRPGNLSAAASDPPTDVPLTVQPAPPAGSLMTAAHNAGQTLLDIGRDAQMLVAPMARGTRDSMAIAKDFANGMRRNRWEWSRIDADIEKRFTVEQRARMWNAADEESVLLQEGAQKTPALPPSTASVEVTTGGKGFRDNWRAENGQGWVSASVDTEAKVVEIHTSTLKAETQKGQGHGTNLYRAIIDKGLAEGYIIESSRSVSREARHLYDGLREKGYTVETVNAAGMRGARAPVYRITRGPSGYAHGHIGLSTLEPAERAAVEDLQSRAQTAWLRAVDLGMVEGEGLPAYTPRMVMNATHAGASDGAIPLNGIGLNLRTKTPNLRKRQHMTVEETEAAAKAKYGADAYVARDIRALPLATGQLEDAIAGRTLINNIKDYGKSTGTETVSEGAIPAGTETKWFALDHPAFRTWRPKIGEVDGKMQAVKDADGNAIFEQVPLYVHGDFEGPLRAVLSQRSGPLYGAAMSLKGKTMSLIMNSPMIHNAVEWGRALPAMPGKVATFKVYFEGNRVKNDPVQMREAIDAGLVPIGKRFFNQDITSVMEAPDLAPGRSFTAKVLGAVPGLFDEGAGVAVKEFIDKAGDFWHNTLLWDRIADLQAGLYSNFRDDMLAKGLDRQTAARTAAHWANRYAGALPQEAMSDAARKVSNMLLFSRSFTMGNLGAMKDMLTGLPKDVIAQIERDAGFGRGSIAAADAEAPAAQAVAYAKTLARRKAMAVVGLDVGLMYVGNSLLQSVINVVRTDRTADQEMKGYADRFSAAMDRVHEHPLTLLQPLGLLESLSSTSENEPGKGDRIRVGTSKDGTAIYMRNPAGKIGEEFVGYMTGPLDMMRRKMGTIARPGWQILSNDKGFGRKVYDPNADTPAKYMANLGRIAAHLAMSQVPEGQMSAAMDMVKGEGDPNVNAAQALGPLGGVTFSKGAPGGPAVGEMYRAREMHDFAVQRDLPDIRKQIQRGDLAGAQERMTTLAVPPGLQKFYIRTSQFPETRLGGRTLKDFYLYATPEQRQRLERARQ